MKKFEFRLQALLRVREFREKQVKSELGEILRQIQQLKDLNLQCDKDISEAYLTQEKMLETMVDAQFLNFYPYYIEGKKQNIQNNEAKIFALKKRYDAKLEELKQAKADVHVIEGLKEKEQVKHKKAVDKHLQDILDESSLRKEYMKRMTKVSNNENNE